MLESFHWFQGCAARLRRPAQRALLFEWR
jgi:hypothetical protein